MQTQHELYREAEILMA